MGTPNKKTSKKGKRGTRLTFASATDQRALQTVIILCVVILVGIGVSLIRLDYFNDARSAQVQTRNTCFGDASQILELTNRLERQMRRYVDRSEQAALDSCLLELRNVAEHTHASQHYRNVNAYREAFTYLDEAHSTCKELAQRSAHAAALTFLAHHGSSTDLPDELATVTLTDEEKALDRQQMIQQARSLVHDDSYRVCRTEFQNAISAFRQNMGAALDARAEKIGDKIDLYLRILIIITLCCFVLFIVFIYMILRSLKAINLNTAVIKGLSKEYSCMLYVRNEGDPTKDISTIYADDTLFKEHIAGWAETTLFTDRLTLIANHICHPDDRTAFIEKTRRTAILTGILNGAEYSVPFRGLIGDVVHYYKMVFVADNDSQGNLLGFSVGLLNMNELVEMEAERLKALDAQQRATEASKMKTLFVQNISHDIRTPLNAIVGYGQLLSMPDMYLTDEEKVEFAEYIASSSEILTMLIDDILELSDIENNVVQISRSDCSCNEICNKAVQCSKMRAQPGVNMYYTSDLDASFHINTDPRRVQQILTNFLTNACKHTSKGEIRVHCSAEENPGYITFSVTDTGTGVDEEIAHDIFERFTSFDRIVGGHGLGLNICKDLSTRLSGDVRLDTDYHDGARFYLILPNTNLKALTTEELEAKRAQFTGQWEYTRDEFYFVGKEAPDATIEGQSQLTIDIHADNAYDLHVNGKDGNAEITQHGTWAITPQGTFTFRQASDGLLYISLPRHIQQLDSDTLVFRVSKKDTGDVIRTYPDEYREKYDYRLTYYHRKPSQG